MKEHELKIDPQNDGPTAEEWDLIPDTHKNQIERGLKQADAGLGTSLKEVNERLKAKYGLND